MATGQPEKDIMIVHHMKVMHEYFRMKYNFENIVGALQSN